MKESVDWQMGSPSRHRERGWEFRRWRDPSTLGLRRRMCLLTFFYTETLFLLPCHGWLITLPVGGKASVSTMGREGETENHTTNLQPPPHPVPSLYPPSLHKPSSIAHSLQIAEDFRWLHRMSVVVLRWLIVCKNANSIFLERERVGEGKRKKRTGDFW